IENDLVLKYTNPSIKGELVTKNFHARVTIDSPPLAIDGFHIDIRKLRKKPYTLPELIANKTLTLEAAAYIYYCLINRCNITVIGEPGAGKTTMINALDLLTPHIWRKIVIEDAIESIPQTEYGFHQLRLKCGKQDLEEKNGNEIYNEKSREIAKLLHRSPDWVYLGEILYPEDARAMFHALSAGLKGLQTCHGETPENVIIRWVIHHKIPAVALQPLDLILHMKKIVEKREIKRKLVQICEIKDVIDINRQENGEKLEENEKTGRNQERGEKIIELPDQKVVLVDTFQYFPKTNQAERVIKNLFMTPTLEKIKRYSYIKEERFKETLQKLEKTLKNLTLTKTFNIKQVKNSLLNTIRERKEIS
ncbi:MAG: ATPase, T2SS/T4P/T4SS family, partial [Candidatus Wukongarchaeota archaeon]|nr:ATPase, T2SS/T4P/T4SS family [Candidatus Wukongarchaeota archaeon]